MHGAKRTITALAVAAAALAAGPGSAHAAKRMEIAVQDDSVFLYQQHYPREAAFKQLRDFGGSRLKVNLIWRQTMPEAQRTQTRKPSRVLYDFSLWENVVNRARDWGLKVQLTLTGPAPVWATGNQKDTRGIFRPNARYFGEFAKLVAKRFGRKVDQYAVWIEPNWFTWLQPFKENGLIYRGLYQAAYRNVKSANPRARVLIGETAPYSQGSRAKAPLAFLRQMTCLNSRYKVDRRLRSKCKGGQLVADGYAHHPYDFVKSPTSPRSGADNVTIASLNRLTAALDRMKSAKVLRPRTGKALSLYLTEYGYFRNGRRKQPESRRARWLRQAYDIAQKNPRVRQILQYVLVEPDPQGNSAFFDLSVILRDGTLTPTYKSIASYARSAQRSGKVAKPGRVKGGGVVPSNAPPPVVPDGSGGSGGSGGGSGGGTSCVLPPPLPCPS